MNCKYSIYHIKSRDYLIILEKLIFKMIDKNYLNVFENQKVFFESNTTLDINYRINSLKKLKREIQFFENDIIDALKKDLGKSLAESYMSEIGIIYNEINYVLKKIKKWSKKTKVSSSLFNFFSSDYILPCPYGVTLNISPWNYPFQLSISPIIGAISAGNTVVLKPSEHSPHTTSILQIIIDKCFERGHVDLVTGGPEIGQKLLELDWDYIFFTGSTEIGKIVAREAANTLTPVTLELGGNNPCIVDKNISLKTTSKRIIWGKFLNCGQTCIAPNFLAVNSEIKDVFLKKLVSDLKNTFSDKPNESPIYSRIINEKHVDRLSKLIDGYKLIHGGNYNKQNNYFEPTILEVDSIKDKILHEEIFGPILPILTYNSIEDLNKILKEYKNPLAFYVFSNNISFAENLISTNSFGGGAINDTIGQIVNKKLPFGGIGNSGIGKYHGYESFKTFSHFKPFIIKSNYFDLSFKYKLSESSILFKITRKFLKHISI